MKEDPIKITGLTLVDKILEFTAMEPDSSEWTFEKQKDNPPRLIRLKQINVLAALFVPEIYSSKDIKSIIESIIEGQFILNREIDIYSKLFLEMDAVIQQRKHYPEKREAWTTMDLQDNYQEILKYKIKLNELLDFNSGIMEISYPYYYSVILTNGISDKIKSGKIDSFLLSVIDPQKRVFKKESLIKKYNYPPENVYHEDLEWW